MKGGLDYRARIPRMLVPSVKRGHAANTPEIAYFHKIKGGPGLLEKYDFDMPVRTARQSLTSHNFYLSKRLQNLSRARPVRRELDSSRETKSARQKIVSHRNISRHDQIYDQEIANINKTISGTRIGALSALQIMEGLQSSEQQIRDESFYGFDRLVKRMDSDFAQESSTMKKGHKVISKLPIFQGKNLEKRMQSIYQGADGFLQKYREYQMSLLQKVPSYKSKHLTLDYKNEWRI